MMRLNSIATIFGIKCVLMVIFSISSGYSIICQYDKSGNCTRIGSENATRGEGESKLGIEGITRWYEVNYDSKEDRVAVKVEPNAEDTEDAFFQVFDSGGRVLSSGTAVSGEVSYVSMCDYPKGVYVVTLVCGQRRESAVFVK